MKYETFIAATAMVAVATTPVATTPVATTPVAGEPALTEVATFTETRPGNVAVAPDGRIFVSMQPLDAPGYRVVEVGSDGSHTPFPTEDWADGPGGDVGFAAGIGIDVASDGTVWMLDMGGPEVAPKLVGWDTAEDTLAASVPVPADVVLPNSFLQDFALDEERGVAVIADMTLGNMIGEARPAFVVLDLETGEARRVLQGHASFLPPDEPVEIDGRRLSNRREDGTTVDLRFSLNPVAIDPGNQWIYYGTVSGDEIHRVPAALLADPTIREGELTDAIEAYGPKSPSDGIAVDERGRVTDVVASAIGVTTEGSYEVLVDDPRLSWPDGFDFGPDGALYVTQNELHRHAAFNRGEEAGTPPYALYRIAPSDLAEPR